VFLRSGTNPVKEQEEKKAPVKKEGSKKDLVQGGTSSRPGRKKAIKTTENTGAAARGSLNAPK